MQVNYLFRRAWVPSAVDAVVYIKDERECEEVKRIALLPRECSGDY